MFIAPNRYPELAEEAARLASCGGEGIVLVSLGEKDLPDMARLIEDLNATGISYAGAIFPAVIDGGQAHKAGAVLTKLAGQVSVTLVKGLGDAENALPDLPAVNQSGSTGTKPTALVLLDGLTPHVAYFLSQLYNRYDTRAQYLGGGAGSLSLVQMPCIFTEEGLFQDAAVVLLIDRPLQLAVRHGWSRLMGPIVATKVDKNRILELNWQNAFGVYKNVVEPEAGQQFTADNFFDIAKGFPFGMAKDGQEDVVRDPIMVDDEGALVCVGEVPSNSVLYILKGSPESLVAAAREAATVVAQSAYHGETIMMNCISRALYLEDGFTEELEAIQSSLPPGSPPISGALTLGEISSYGDGYLEFFNKTTVIGTFN